MIKKSIPLFCVLLVGFAALERAVAEETPKTAPTTTPTTKPADTQALQGTWVVVKKVKNGADEAVSKDAGQLTFAGEQVFSTTEGKDTGSGRFTLDQTGTLKRIVFVAVTGPYAGRTFSAIYQIDGNTLKLAYSTGNDNEARPKDFEGGQNEAMEVLEKQKL